jgi:hypothetical protein
MASGCGSVPSSNVEVDELAQSLCSRYGAICVPLSVADDLGIANDEDVGWGVFKYKRFTVLDEDLRVGYVVYDDEKCAEDLELCGFVILHEIGHLYRGSSQTAADCFAGRRSTQAQYDAGVDFICGHGWANRCDALAECSP